MTDGLFEALRQSLILAGATPGELKKLAQPDIMTSALKLARGEGAVVPMVSLDQHRKVKVNRNLDVDFMGLLQEFAPKWVTRADPEWIDSASFKNLQRTGPESFDVAQDVLPWYHPRDGILLVKIMEEVQVAHELHHHLGLADAPGIFGIGAYNFGQVFGEDTTLALLKSAFRLKRKSETDQYDWRVPVIFRDGPDLRVDIRWMGNACLDKRHALGMFARRA